MIRVNHLNYSVPGRKLVDDLSFTVPAGEIVALVGPNGAGKSTALKLISGDITPESGEILIREKHLKDWSLRNLATFRAVVTQETQLNFPFTALEVVLMGRIPGTPRMQKHDVSVAISCLEATQLQDMHSRIYPTLSGGEKQRIQISRALAQLWDTPPHERILLLDEPLASLDINHQHHVLQWLLGWKQLGMGCVIVVHDLNLAAQYADRILLLRDGALLANGAPQDVLSPKLVHEAYGINVDVIQHPCYGCPLIIHAPENYSRSVS